jgi:sulfate adenylyltransferase subunit 2
MTTLATVESETRQIHPARLNHLQALEAESISILREAVAEFARPVMLYSIGKDSSVMLRLAQKAFYPGKIPFPLLHVDTSYKFPEMIRFRDEYTREIGADLIVHRNESALAAGANPYTLGTQNCCGLLKTRSLLDALEEGGFDAAFGPPRRRKIPCQGARLLLPRFCWPVGSEEPAPRTLEPLQLAPAQGREHPRLPALQLD